MIVIQVIKSGCHAHEVLLSCFYTLNIDICLVVFFREQIDCNASDFKIKSDAPEHNLHGCLKKPQIVSNHFLEFSNQMHTTLLVYSSKKKQKHG